MYILISSNVEENGLLRCHALHKATEYDSILCAEVADIDWDGKNELILGTFGKVCSLEIVVFIFFICSLFNVLGHTGF